MSRVPRVPIDLRGLDARQEIFRVSKTLQRDSNVDAWLTGEPAELRSLARQWFLRMRGCGHDVREVIHDGCPVACIEDAPFGYVNAFASHINVGFFNGALLADPAGMLQGSGKRMRHVKIRSGDQANAAGLGDLITSAYQDMKNRLNIERSLAK